MLFQLVHHVLMAAMFCFEVYIRRLVSLLVVVCFRAVCPDIGRRGVYHGYVVVDSFIRRRDLLLVRIQEATRHLAGAGRQPLFTLITGGAPARIADAVLAGPALGTRFVRSGEFGPANPGNMDCVVLWERAVPYWRLPLEGGHGAQPEGNYIIVLAPDSI
eukprot:GHVU01231629.1.p1 GENE.GHVU01231629.1~~GHVU01231629.1.p1  ORF type:complete len:160 (-),score=2.33 GHVU01231629.1:647-1126(-)